MIENSRSKTYQWVITTLIALLCFSIGWSLQSERLRAQVITNTVKIQTIDFQLININIKLDKLLERRSEANGD